MTRLPNWQSALEAHLRASAQVRFAYGAMDCCLFACDAVLAMTGEDLAASFRGKYSTRREASIAIRSYCGSPLVRSLAERIARDRAIPDVDVAHARRGDVVLHGRNLGESLGIVSLDGTEMIAVAQDGLWRLPLCMAKRAWRIG